LFWKALQRGEASFLATLRQGALFPYVYALLAEQAPTVSLPPELLAELRNAYLCSVRQAVVQESEAARVLGSLAGAGLDIVLLKGADLRLRVYPDPAVRPMTDLDLLVPPEQAGRARSLLTGLGYTPLEPEPRPGFLERFGHALGLQPPPEFSLYVDLHWEIREGLGYYRLPYEVIKPRLQEVLFHGLPLKVLAPEHLLIHLCLHTYWEFSQWRQFLDLALAIRRLPLNRKQFAAAVKACRCEVPVCRVLDLGRSLLPEPSFSPTALGLSDTRPGLAERFVADGTLGPLIPYLAVLSHHPLQDWLPFLAAKLWPQRSYLAAKLGSASRWRYLLKFLRKFQKKDFL